MNHRTPTTILVSRNVVRLRCSVGLTQDAMAEKAGIHANTYVRMERGNRNTTLVTLAKVADALGVTPNYLLEDYRG
jgi:transcriptional regulator with XRE-family HTH domain